VWDKVLVLNKVDMFPEPERDAKVAKMKKGLAKVFTNTR
jgi:hypothetical protein